MIHARVTGFTCLSRVSDINLSPIAGLKVIQRVIFFSSVTLESHTGLNKNTLLVIYTTALLNSYI